MTCWAAGEHGVQCLREPTWKIVSPEMGERYSCEDHLLCTIKTLGDHAAVVVMRLR